VFGIYSLMCDEESLYRANTLPPNPSFPLSPRIMGKPGHVDMPITSVFLPLMAAQLELFFEGSEKGQGTQHIVTKHCIGNFFF